MTEAARAEAFASQADRSRELAAGYVKQAIDVSRQVSQLRDSIAVHINGIAIPHRWNGSRLELLNPQGAWVSGPDLRGSDARGVDGIAVVEGRFIVTYSDAETADLGPALGDMFQHIYDPNGHAADAFDMASMIEADNAKVMTADERNEIAANTAVRHSHPNKAVLDATEEGFTTALKTMVDGAEQASNKGVANGYAALGSDGKIPESQLPAVAITDTFPVNSQAEMLALTVQRGDVAVRSDINKSFILRIEPATTLANWTELRTPTDAVLSVAGKTGAVTLVKADVGLGNVDNTSDASKPISNAVASALAGKASSAQGEKADTALQPSDIGDTVQAYASILDALSMLSLAGNENKQLIVNSAGDGLVMEVPASGDFVALGAPLVLSSAVASVEIPIPSGYREIIIKFQNLGGTGGASGNYNLRLSHSLNAGSSWANSTAISINAYSGSANGSLENTFASVFGTSNKAVGEITVDKSGSITWDTIGQDNSALRQKLARSISYGAINRLRLEPYDSNTPSSFASGASFQVYGIKEGAA